MEAEVFSSMDHNLSEARWRYVHQKSHMSKAYKFVHLVVESTHFVQCTSVHVYVMSVHVGKTTHTYTNIWGKTYMHVHKCIHWLIHNIPEMFTCTEFLLRCAHAMCGAMPTPLSTRVCSSYICYVVAFIACTRSTFDNGCILSSFFSFILTSNKINVDYVWVLRAKMNFARTMNFASIYAQLTCHTNIRTYIHTYI